MGRDYLHNVAVDHPRIARQGEVIPRMGVVIPTKAEQINKLVLPFSCRARGSNPVPLEIVLMQLPLHHQGTI